MDREKLIMEELDEYLKEGPYDTEGNVYSLLIYEISYYLDNFAEIVGLVLKDDNKELRDRILSGINLESEQAVRGYIRAYLESTVIACTFPDRWKKR